MVLRSYRIVPYLHFKSGSDGSDFGPGDLSLKSFQPGDLVQEFTHFLARMDISHEINLLKLKISILT